MSYFVGSLSYAPPVTTALGFWPNPIVKIQDTYKIVDFTTFNLPLPANPQYRGILDYFIKSFSDILYGQVYVSPAVINTGILLEEKQYTITVWNTKQSETLSDVLKFNFDGINLQEPQTPPFAMAFLGDYEYIVTVSTTGPATINALARFQFIGQTNDVSIIGSRAVWIPFRPQVISSETIENKTDVITTYNGKEQRIRTLINPKQKISYKYKLFQDEITTMQLILGGWYARAFLTPIWSEAVKYEGVITAGTSVIFLDTTLSDFRIGEAAYIWQDNQHNIISPISGVYPTYIELADALAEDYISPQVIPAYASTTEGPTPRAVYPSPHLVEYSTTFTMNAPKYIGDDSYYPIKFKGFSVVTDSPYRLPANDNILEESDYIDYGTGATEQIEKWNRSRHNRSWNKRFHQSEYFSFKKWVQWMRGSQQMLFMPSGEKDFVVLSDIINGTVEVIIDFIGWSAFKTKVPYQYICITDPRDGKLLMSGVNDVIDNGNGTETLYLRDALVVPSTLVYQDIKSSQFMFLMRFASDTQVIRAESGGVYTFKQELIGVDYEL